MSKCTTIKCIVLYPRAIIDVDRVKLLVYRNYYKLFNNSHLYLQTSYR